MNRVPALQALIPDLYAAAFDPERIAALHLAAARRMGGHGFHFCVWDRTQATQVRGLTSPDYDVGALEAYGREYGALDHARMRLARSEVGDIVATQQLFDTDFVGADTFHQEFLAPLDIRWRLALCLWRDDLRDCYLTVLRAPGHGVFEPAHLRDLARLKPHLVRSAVLAERAAQLRAEAALGQAALDALAFGVVATTGTARICYANQRAETWLADGIIPCGPRRLLGGGASANAMLVAETFAAVRADGVSRTVALSAAERGIELLLTLCRLPRLSALGGWVEAAEYLALIRRPVQRRGLNRAQLAVLFGLTAAEAALAEGLGHGCTLEQVARARGVKISTARSQLAAVLAKTGCRRQQDLLRLLLR